MKSLLLLLVVGIVAAHAVEERSFVYQMRAWADASYNGEYRDFDEPVPYLDAYHFDNTIESVRVRGVWIFYEQPEYNAYQAAGVHWSWGLDYKETFHDGMQNRASSLRYAGSQLTLNEDGYNLYEGTLFTKKHLYETNSIEDLSQFHQQQVHSIIIIGKSSWKFCEGTHYTGRCKCLSANSHDESYYDRLDVGFYKNIQNEQGLYNVKSVKKGCY